MRIRGLYAIVVLTVVVGCESPQGVVNSPVDLPGTSNAEGSAVLARDVLNTIDMIDRGKDPACDSRKLTETRIVEDIKDGVFSPSGVLISGKWLEVWTIDRCGSPISYSVEFTADGAGGTYFGISSD